MQSTPALPVQVSQFGLVGIVARQLAGTENSLEEQKIAEAKRAKAREDKARLEEAAEEEARAQARALEEATAAARERCAHRSLAWDSL